MNVKRGLYINGIVSLLSGIALVPLSITGFAIFDRARGTVSFIGLILIAGGVFLLAAAKNWNRYRVGLVIREYESGTLNPVQAALKINDKLYPDGIEITGVNYRGGINETIKAEKEQIPIRLGDREKARDLALALYEVALINDRSNSRNCELHLSKRASSKHHKTGLQKIIDKFEEKYEKDLKTARVD